MSNNKEIIIFLDLDSVLVNFVKGSLFALGVTEYTIPPNEPNMERWPGVNVSVRDFWKAIDKTESEFWLNLEKYDYADELVDYSLSKGQVFFLTSPSRNPYCLSGKAMWLQRHFPKLTRKVIYTPAKYLCAAPNRILVDDSLHKVKPFIDHGGRAVLFPQPYNVAWNQFVESKLSTIDYTKRMIDSRILEINSDGYAASPLK